MKQYIDLVLGTLGICFASTFVYGNYKLGAKYYNPLTHRYFPSK